MRKLTRMRIFLSVGAVALVSILGGTYHFGGVTAAALGALAVLLAVPFLLGRLGNQTVRAGMGQPDQLKHRELRILVDEVNELLASFRRAKEELGVGLNGQGSVEASMTPLSRWAEKRAGPVPLYMTKGSRLDNLQLDQIAGVRKKVTKLEADLAEELEIRLDEQEREIVAGLLELGYPVKEDQSPDTPKAEAKGAGKQLGALVSSKVERRSQRVCELEEVIEDLKATCSEVEHEFPSVGEYHEHLKLAQERLVEMDVQGAVRLLKDAASGIAKRPKPRFDKDRAKLLKSIITIKETGVLEFVDQQDREAFTTYSRIALDEKNPLRYRRLLDHTLQLPERVASLLRSLEQECVKIDKIMEKDYFIEYQEKFPALDQDIRTADVVGYAGQAAERIGHLKEILEEHADERRISENYTRVEKRIRRLLQEQDSVGPEDLKVRAPERYMRMFAQREAAVVLEGGRLRLATESDTVEMRDPVNDLGQAEMEYEG